MKLIFRFLSLITLFVILFFFQSSKAQSDLNINGYIKTDNRLRLDSNEFTWNENRLNLKFEGAPTDKYHFFSEVRLRGFGFPNVNQSSDLQRQEKDRVYHWGLEFREAYVDLYGFAFDNLDIRIGRQIISWGTADKLNPTSNISPDDLEDIFNFGEQLGINAFKANYYIGEVTLTGVYVPVFTPATFPFGDFSNAFLSIMPLPPGLTLRNFYDHIMLPENKVSQISQYAFKAATNLFNYDISLSYFKGRDDLPIVNRVSLTPVNLSGTVDIMADMIYPKIQVLGADFSGSLGSVGFWGEGALFFPEKVVMPIYLNSPFGSYLQEKAIALDDKPYLKYVIGGDYTFKNGLYFNAQFLHGFIHERGSENLNDYFAFRFEQKFHNDEIKIAPLNGAIAINDWNNIKNNYGFVCNPEITYYPNDNIELVIGAFWLEGKGINMFSQIKDFDEIYVKTKVSF